MIEVVGIGAAGWDALGARERALVLAAHRVLGGPRHLDLLPAVPGQERAAWPRDLRDALPGLVAGHEDRPVVVLASGDPLLAGVGSTLVDLLGADAVRVHPAVSSVALAAARLGWAADTYALVRLRAATSTWSAASSTPAVGCWCSPATRGRRPRWPRSWSRTATGPAP